MSVEITTADVYRRSWSWIGAVLSMELRKIFSYRVDFWLQVVGGFFSQFVVAYYLWQAIFEHNQAEKIGGYSFPMMVAYYVLAPFVDRIVRANNAFVISQEIYEGSLSRYLISGQLFGVSLCLHPRPCPGWSRPDGCRCRSYFVDLGVSTGVDNWLVRFGHGDRVLSGEHLCLLSHGFNY